MLQHGRTSKISCSVKEASHKKLSQKDTEGANQYKQNRSVVTQGQEQVMSAKKPEKTFQGDENF